MKYRFIIGIIALSVILLGNRALAQEAGYELSGTVKNINVDPLPNITVSILGSVQPPAVTDDAGEYKIEVPSGEVWISFVPVGDYVERTVFLNSRKALNIYFDYKNRTSNHELVLGEGQRKPGRNVIGAGDHMLSGHMKYNTHSTIDQLFQTSVTGAQVSNMSGMPGSGTSIFLRGIGSAYAGGQPLFVVDGIPMERSRYYSSLIDGYNYSPVSTIDPSDVSFISVYKDPSYTSQYGLYGGNGVIELRTIFPDASTTTIDVKYRIGLDMKPDYQKQLDAIEYKVLANELLFSSGMFQEDYELEYPGLFYRKDDTINYRLFNHNTQWQDEVFQNALSQNIHFSIKGGDAVAKYGISFGYLTGNGMLKSTSYDRFNTRFVGSFNIIERIAMSLNVNYTTTTSNLRASGLDEVRSQILSGLWKSPLLSPYQYDEDGNQLGTTAEVDVLGVSNPLALAREFKGLADNSRFSISARVNGEINNNLSLVTLLGLNYNLISESVFSPDLGMNVYYDGEVYNESSVNSNTYFGAYVNSYLSYNSNPDGTGRNTLVANLGLRTISDKFENDYGIGGNSPSDEYKDLEQGEPNLRRVGGRNIDYSYFSMYGNINYNIINKYYLDFKLSADASSAIGIDAETPFSMGNVPYEIFYSAGAAWRISNEDFLKNLSILEDLRIRASYGTSGSDNFDILLSRSHYLTNQFNVVGVSIPGSSANSALRSEKRNYLNVGSDLSLIGGKHQLSVDMYYSITNDLLLFQDLPSFTGVEYYPLNSGRISNRGIEFSSLSRLVQKSDFALDLGIKLGANKNRVEELPVDQVIIPLPGLGEIVMSEGNEFNAFYGYEFDGVFATTSESQEANLTNNRGIPFSAGDARFVDKSGPQGVPDGIIDDFDKVILGSPNPELMGSASLVMKYKKWQLDIVTQFMTGQEIFNYTRFRNEEMAFLHNQSASTLNRWTYETQQTDIPRASWGDPVGNNDFSSRWIEDGSYLRLKNITLSYSTAKKIIPGVRKIEVFLKAVNILTLTRYTGYDPEFSYSFNPLYQGIDYSLTPQPRSLFAGINISL